MASNTSLDVLLILPLIILHVRLRLASFVNASAAWRWDHGDSGDRVCSQLTAWSSPSDSIYSEVHDENFNPKMACNVMCGTDTWSVAGEHDSLALRGISRTPGHVYAESAVSSVA